MRPKLKPFENWKHQLLLIIKSDQNRLRLVTNLLLLLYRLVQSLDQENLAMDAM